MYRLLNLDDWCWCASKRDKKTFIEKCIYARKVYRSTKIYLSHEISRRNHSRSVVFNSSQKGGRDAWRFPDALLVVKLQIIIMIKINQLESKRLFKWFIRASNQEKWSDSKQTIVIKQLDEIAYKHILKVTFCLPFQLIYLKCYFSSPSTKTLFPTPYPQVLPQSKIQ